MQAQQEKINDEYHPFGTSIEGERTIKTAQKKFNKI